jgi:hypothetical protein
LCAEVWLHLFLTLTLYGEEWSASRPSGEVKTPLDPEYEVGWTPESGWMLCRRKKNPVLLLSIEPRIIGLSGRKVFSIPAVQSRFLRGRRTKLTCVPSSFCSACDATSVHTLARTYQAAFLPLRSRAQKMPPSSC